MATEAKPAVTYITVRSLKYTIGYFCEHPLKFMERIMPPLNRQLPPSIGIKTTYPDSGRFKGMATSEVDATRHTEGNALPNEAPTLNDRLTYPLRAAKDRIIYLSALGAKIGISIPTYVAGTIFALAGGIIGVTVGRLIKYQFFPNAETHPETLGASIGFVAGSFLAYPAAIVLCLVTSAAFTIISPACIFFTFPVDIYNAITLNNKADMYPDKSAEEEF